MIFPGQAARRTLERLFILQFGSYLYLYLCKKSIAIISPDKTYSSIIFCDHSYLLTALSPDTNINFSDL